VLLAKLLTFVQHAHPNRRSITFCLRPHLVGCLASFGRRDLPARFFSDNPARVTLTTTSTITTDAIVLRIIDVGVAFSDHALLSIEDRQFIKARCYDHSSLSKLAYNLYVTFVGTLEFDDTVIVTLAHVEATRFNL